MLLLPSESWLGFGTISFSAFLRLFVGLRSERRTARESRVRGQNRVPQRHHRRRRRQHRRRLVRYLHLLHQVLEPSSARRSGEEEEGGGSVEVLIGVRGGGGQCW